MKFGHYEQDDDSVTTNEPITWRILAVKDGKYLVISEKALDVQKYDITDIYIIRETDFFITWEKSTIRSWLNGYGSSYNTVGMSFTSSNFIDTAFTDIEKAKIKSSEVPAHANPEYSTSPGNATTDKIFLLSITEAQNYFTSDNERRAEATPYARNKGAFTGNFTELHYSYWWLRSTGSRGDHAAFVNIYGSFSAFPVYDPNIAVRPAMWVEF